MNRRTVLVRCADAAAGTGARGRNAAHRADHQRRFGGRVLRALGRLQRRNPAGDLQRPADPVHLRHRAAMVVPAWVDRTIATAVVNISDQYDNLTRRHRLSRTGRWARQDTVTTEDDAMVRQWLTTLTRLPLCETSKLDPSRDYYVRISARARPTAARMIGLGERGHRARRSSRSSRQARRSAGRITGRSANSHPRRRDQIPSHTDPQRPNQHRTTSRDTQIQRS